MFKKVMQTKENSNYEAAIDDAWAHFYGGLIEKKQLDELLQWIKKEHAKKQKDNYHKN